MKRILMALVLGFFVAPVWAENDDPQVVAFSNNRVRPMADVIYSAYFRAKSVLADYNAGNIGTLIDNEGAGELIADGSATDGRTRITGGDIYNFITACQELVDYVEGGAVATLDRNTTITKPHVNQF